MTSIICPTILASSKAEYAAQMRVVAPFSKRLQIDLMDGEFASPQSINLNALWWPPHTQVDIHLMYEHPMDYLPQLLHLQPHMVIVHVESMFHHMHFAAELHKEGIKAGLAVVPTTPIANVEQIINSFDHLLIFSGHLGHFGGQADLSLLIKVQDAKEHHPDLEFGWDGGINTDNVRQLAQGGINVLNVGSFIQTAPDPQIAYNTLVETIA